MKKIQLFSVVIATALFVASCGQSKKEENKNTETPSANQGATAPTTAPVTEGAIVITANDMMKFDLDHIKVKAGEKVKITLVDAGKMTKDVMGHNFVILNKGVDVTAFAEKALKAKDTDYIPASEAANIIAHTKLLGAGESDTIEFTAPAAGEYDYICSFPGHYGNMKGKLIVE